MAIDPKIGLFWKLLFGTVTCLSLTLPVLSDWSKMAKTTCPDGFGLNYTLPMSQKCQMKRLHNGSMRQSIPKLTPFPSVVGGCHRRKSKEGIPGGQRICRIPDCGEKLCQNGWCEETMVGYNCHCSSGFQGRHCDEQSRESSTTDATTKPMTKPTTSRKTWMSDTATPQETTTSTTPACQDLTGVNYRGNLSLTIKGHTCQAWTSHDTHAHQVWTPANFPKAGLDNNFCRNPVNIQYTAWCYTTNPEIRWDFCAVGYLDPRCQATPACREDPTGVNYRGTLSHTVNDHTCQSWTSQDPYQHTTTPANYPNAGLDNNYCRNPDMSSTAWCYTTNPMIKWEFCAVGYLDPICLGSLV